MFVTQVQTLVLVVIVAALVAAASEIAYLVARGKEWANDPGFGAAQGAAFALVGLLLGFSFSLAISRFDARRAVVVKEANAIGTTYLRTSFLEPTIAKKMRDDLRAYSLARLDFAEAGTLESRRGDAGERSQRLQNDMWGLATTAMGRDGRSTSVALFVAALNDTIDVSSEQQAALGATIPDAVLFILVLVTVIAAGLLGFNYARTNRDHLIPTIMFAVMLALTLGLILDLDRPQRGLVRVNLQPLRSLQSSFDSFTSVK